MKKLILLFAAAIYSSMFIACSNSDDETSAGNSQTALYAIIKTEGAQLIDIIPSDYVLTLDNVIAVNPEMGEFKLKDTERIDSKAYPIPTQYVIQFYSEGSFLFEAKLNSAISSYLPNGLTFCHFMSDNKGLARYDLGATRILNADGNVIEGDITELQEIGIQRMYQILQKAGKINYNIEYDFQY